ncbi:hypothetical protein RRG08_061347 [Elysia crispata]|uniref:Uncharacterized protein n=1 Tax=Elysia crispata TaxID=231223 RepID=A0AAE1DXL2_9GAST|nr:hypothetical protein RRG08_061347 [Elysia crispata]
MKGPLQSRGVCRHSRVDPGGGNSFCSRGLIWSPWTGSRVRNLRPDPPPREACVATDVLTLVAATVTALEGGVCRHRRVDPGGGNSYCSRGLIWSPWTGSRVRNLRPVPPPREACVATDVLILVAATVTALEGGVCRHRRVDPGGGNSYCSRGLIWSPWTGSRVRNLRPVPPPREACVATDVLTLVAATVTALEV